MFSVNLLRPCSLFLKRIETRQTISKDVIYAAPAAALSSSVCKRITVHRPLFRQQIYPSHQHHLQRRLLHEHDDDRERTIHTVDKIAIRHLSAGFFKMISNLVKYYYIQTFYDKSFKVTDFVKGAKAGICFVSNGLANGNTESLHAAVSEDTLSSAENSVNELNEDKRSLLIIQNEDIFHFGILDIGIIEEREKRYVEITTVACAKERSQWEVPKSLKKLEERDSTLQEMNMFQLLDLIFTQDSVLLITCRFIREFTKGVADGWTVNKIHHTFVIPQKH